MKSTNIFIPLLFLCAQFSRAQDQPSKITGDIQKIVLKRISNAIDSYYVYPEKGKLISAFLSKQTSENKYDSLTRPGQLADKITRDIRSIQNDIHLRVIYDPKLEKDIITFTSSKKGANEINESDIKKDEKKNFSFKKLEILPSNIGYMELTGFVPPSPAARKTLQAAMEFLSHTDALIIDLRNNFGGNTTMAEDVLGYFFQKKTFTGKSFNRIENKWSDNFLENKKQLTGGLVMKMPVYIINSNRTYSAGEGFSYTLQSLKKAVIIGDTTRGGAHLTRSFSAGNGFVVFIPYLRSENVVTRTDWETTGVIPDIVTTESNSMLTTQKIILKDKLSAATEDTEKRKLNWLINYYTSKEAPVVINPKDFNRYTGRFAEFEISVKDGQLVLRDVNQRTPGYKKLTAIDPYYFQVDSDYQVEFINDNDNDGLFNSIKMYWDDGWVEKIQKNK